MFDFPRKRSVLKIFGTILERADQIDTTDRSILARFSKNIADRNVPHIMVRMFANGQIIAVDGGTNIRGPYGQVRWRQINVKALCNGRVRIKAAESYSQSNPLVGNDGNVAQGQLVTSENMTVNLKPRTVTATEFLTYFNEWIQPVYQV